MECFFCDELPEFNKHTLEVLRQPLEDRKITISRAKYTVTYPCSFMFVASMNPCPCGYFADPTHHCVCSPGQIQKYLAKISGPLMDRIDIQCEIAPLPLRISHRLHRANQVLLFVNGLSVHVLFRRSVSVVIVIFIVMRR